MIVVEKKEIVAMVVAEEEETKTKGRLIVMSFWRSHSTRRSCARCFSARHFSARHLLASSPSSPLSSSFASSSSFSSSLIRDLFIILQLIDSRGDASLPSSCLIVVFRVFARGALQWCPLGSRLPGRALKH